MEVSGSVLRQVTYSSFCRRVGGGGACPDGSVPRVGVRRRRVMMGCCGFHDEGHLQYYSSPRCGGKDKGPAIVTNKNKLKLLKGFSKGLSLYPQLALALDPHIHDLQGNLTSDAVQDAAEELIKQLEQLRAEEKEKKRKMKLEKKAREKAYKMKTVADCESSSSSSSSESSESECDEVVNMDSLRAGTVTPAAPIVELHLPALQATIPALLPHTTVVENPIEDVDLSSRNDVSVSGINGGSFKTASTAVTTAAPLKRIEVCMGNKCKKSGAAELLQEFERAVGVEAAVVGCKCMGKCKSAPNVRIQNSVDDSLAKGLNDSVQIPANPLCIGVGLEDVDAIVARFLGENQEDVGATSRIGSHI